MSLSDSDLNLSEFSNSDDENSFSPELYDDLMFYLICQEPDLFKLERKFTGVKDRSIPLDFINSWTDEMFYRQFRMDREDLKDLLALMIAGYSDPSSDGWSNYCYAKDMENESIQQLSQRQVYIFNYN